jgi:8-oxo-dGTP pyrophosphatase MutT (NUDIX family)
MTVDPVPRWATRAPRVRRAQRRGGFAPMTRISVGTIDVYCLSRSSGVWSVLALQRAHDTRCPTAWETVHGHIEAGESPEQAASREVREETRLTVQRLYNVTVQPFYLHKLATVELSVVFAAFVDREQPIALGAEHMRHEWLPADAALERFIWPRERAALRDVLDLLKSGDAGAVEDVLRVF